MTKLLLQPLPKEVNNIKEIVDCLLMQAQVASVDAKDFLQQGLLPIGVRPSFWHRQRCRWSVHYKNLLSTYLEQSITSRLPEGKEITIVIFITL